MATQREILNDMLASLARSEPDLDVGIGSVVRKMLDAVAEAIAERDADDILRGYAYDIDAKSGADLDEMVRLFGFSRLPAQRASGEVTFSRTAPSVAAVAIPAGMQVTTSPSISPIVVASTIMRSQIPPGETSITVPVIAVDAGARGNVSADTLTFRRTPIEGISAVNNDLALTGGTNAESDAHLRKRFRETVFRSLAGTSQMFAGVALDDPNALQVNVLGTVKRSRERVEIDTGAATSTVQDAAYIVPDSALLGANLVGGSLLREGVHYTVNYGVNPPEITVLDAVRMPNGAIFDFEFEYVPNASRNDLGSGITNRVDIYVRGERAVQATASLVFDSARVFAGSGTYTNTNFQRLDESNPDIGNFFVPYPLVPLLQPTAGDGAGQIVIDGNTYVENTHFWLVWDITSQGQAPRSLAGIEIWSDANGSTGVADPADGSDFTVSYIYNEVPRSIESAIGGTWRLLNQDVWVHQGKLKRLRCNLAVILSRGFTAQQVEVEIEAALSSFIDTISFNSTVQASDILAVAHDVAGVDAVRFLTDEDDPVNYAIQRINEGGTVAETYATAVTPKRALDVYCADDESPVLDGVFIDVRAQNTWGSA